MNIAFYIRQQREKAQLSRQQLARLLGVSRQYVHCMESGEFTPSATLCLQISIVLKLDRDVVLLLAGHVPTDVLILLQEFPQIGCALLRAELIQLFADKK